jgi:hypothetical protein
MSQYRDGVHFQDQFFPIREINLIEPWSGFESGFIVSTLELQERLISTTGEYISLDAQALDESIYFYVEEAELKGPLADLEAMVARATELAVTSSRL